MSSPDRRRTDQQWDDNSGYWIDELIVELPPRPWLDDAACLGLDTRAFYGGKSSRETKKALAVCQGCPVRTDCLMYALNLEDHDGVQGGVMGADREIWSALQLDPQWMIDETDLRYPRLPDPSPLLAACSTEDE